MTAAASPSAGVHRTPGHGPVVSSGPLLGRVASFDQTRGLGEVEADDRRRFGFHATAIAGGIRRTEIGVAVCFTLAPGHRGRYEVRSLVPLSG
jgi:cold shock CspA family protein